VHETKAGEGQRMLRRGPQSRPGLLAIGEAYELEIRHRDGSSRPVLYNASVYRLQKLRNRGCHIGGFVVSASNGDNLWNEAGATMNMEVRGFTGIAFRMSSDGSKYECFYMRTKNGRSDDQLQRNHSAQYISEPEFPWQRLRPGDSGQV